MFLLSQRVRAFFSFRTLNWNLSANFKGEHINSSTLEAIVERLKDLRTNNTQVIVKRINKINYLITIIPGPTIDLLYTPQSNIPDDISIESNLPSIYLSVNNYRIGYSQIPQVLSREIAPVLEVIAGVIHSVDALYNFTVDFDKNQNPFFGLYISNVPYSEVSRFLVHLNLQQQGRSGRVVVSESKISITTRSQSVLRDLALQFLTFDPSLGEHLTNV